ncbi:MAG: phenylalanine--tRNA ligase subunit alpha, partial [Candidatus Micrarchaeota archaeon]|nr:phenylalanine--tRNA ligase subunit alpha [Candidatus Micrarchaeota archaeon]
LKALESVKTATILDLTAATKLGKDEVLWAIESLSKQGAVSISRQERTSATLTDEGKKYARSALPEVALIEKAAKKQIGMAEISDQESRIGLQWAKSNGYIRIDAGKIAITDKGKGAISSGIPESKALKKLDFNPDSFASLEKESADAIANLMRRKLLSVSRKSEIVGVSITGEGRALLKTGANPSEIDSLDRKIISGREWADKKFKPYDINVPVAADVPAKIHPLRQMINDVKRAYIGMGFKEVSGPIVIPTFWNFDTLFMPQDHPAREAQDTFYLSNPQRLEIGDKGLVGKVKMAHEAAWHSDWLTDVAMQPVLRTQMTSVSIQELYNLGKYKEYKLPLKLFALGRVFRNENVDYKHLTDFYQTDGIILGENLTMANLFDTLIRLYGSLGLKVRFKPTYFPFVEPGAEMQVYHEVRKEWMEVAGCGILRREITGIARKNITVLAWGASVERLLMIRNPETERLTDLYNNGIGWIRKSRMI